MNIEDALHNIITARLYAAKSVRETRDFEARSHYETAAEHLVQAETHLETANRIALRAQSMVDRLKAFRDDLGKEFVTESQNGGIYASGLEDALDKLLDAFPDIFDDTLAQCADCTRRGVADVDIYRYAQHNDSASIDLCHQCYEKRTDENAP